MYGSYGSYSSMGAMSAPMDITSGNLRTHDSSCAFPSWPQRPSLSHGVEHNHSHYQRASSFLSDDELLFLSDPFDDDARSISSAASLASTSSPPSTSGEEPLATVSSLPVVCEAELHLEMDGGQLAMQREYVRQMMSDKESRRRQQQQQQASRRRYGGGVVVRKSPKSRLSSMTPITEARE